MSDWIAKLDEFLTLSGRRLLEHSGRVSAATAKAKAAAEYENYRRLLDSQPRPVDGDFERVIKQLPKSPPKKVRGGRENR